MAFTATALDEMSGVIDKLDWLKPKSELTKIRGSKFVRNIRASIAELYSNGEPVCIETRTSPKCYVLTEDAYESMLALKKAHLEMINRIRYIDVTKLNSELSSLLERVNSENSALAAQSLLDADVEKLADNYQQANPAVK